MNMMSAGLRDSTTVPDLAPDQPATAGKPFIVEYWQMALRHYRLIAAVVVLALFAGLILTLLATPQYTADSRIEIARQQANVTNVEGLERDEAAPDLEFYSTQYELLESRSLAERVVRRLRLATNEEFFEAHGATPEGAGMLGQSTAPNAQQRLERQEQAVVILQDHIAIDPIRGSALIDVGYTSASPTLSASIANTYVQEFVRQSMDRRMASTADARLFLEQRLDTLRRRLQESERDLVAYAAQQGIIRIEETQSPDGRTRTTQTLATADVQALNTALAEATADRVRAEGLLRAGVQSGSNGQIVPNAALDSLRARRAEVASELAQLLVRFEPQYPQAVALRDQLRSLDAAVATEERRQRGEVSGALRVQFEGAERRERQLRERLDGLLGRLVAENRAGIQYNIFQREVDTNRELYDALLQRYKEIGVAGVGTNNVAVVDEAIPPDQPSAPILPLNLAIALLAGMILSAGIVFVLENVDESVRDPQQLQDKLGVPLLGAIPMDPSTEDDALLHEVADPKSQIAEAYMTVRTNLAFSTDHGVPKSFCIISTGPSEGKSTTSYALARLIARTGKRVVLVDADMRRPRMALMLGVDNSRGLSNFLAGDAGLDALLQSNVADNVTFLAAGPTPPSAAELLSSERTKALVDALSAQFDHVIIDCPPMLGLSDGPLIARVTEGVVYIVQAQRTPVRGALAAIARLRESQARIIGAVLTKYRSNSFGYGYGYGYGYGHDYGKGGEADVTSEDRARAS